MSHSFESEGVTFHYNPDLSGNVAIHYTSDAGKESVDIPGGALYSFMAHLLRNARIEAVENMSDKDVFDSLSR